MRHGKKRIFLGRNPVAAGAGKVEGKHVVLDGEEFYCIANSDKLRPILVSIVSSGNHWMFVSSNGALTAGRGNPDFALFPYYTDDKIHDAAETTGPKTSIIANIGGKEYLWEPFSERGRGIYQIQRNLYKNFVGNKIVFEEINKDLGMIFRYGWASSDEFGWVRKSSLLNSRADFVSVRLLDGLQNLLPCGAGSQFQLEKSTLLDAYKKNELLSECGLGLFLLSSIPVDRPEPAESLGATTVWSVGLERRAVLLSSLQLQNFRRGISLETETDVRAERGAYLVESQFELRGGQSRTWIMAADVDQGPSQVANLRRLLKTPDRLRRSVEADAALNGRELWRIVARADGVQKSARPISDARHFNNVLFNVMLGGTFFEAYQIAARDLFEFINSANRVIAGRHAAFFRKLGKEISRDQMLALARDSADTNLERLCQEYLPLSFSRRHGDPSRPWNRFSIASRGGDGGRILGYEGNWRDIFQNWEALAVSYPGFVSGMICKFVNASTADGYNPYRISRGGFDWEVPDPHDPWAHIGYWGDHQIIYLLKLLEIQDRHDSAVLRGFLTREIFSFANVPYRIKPYAQLLENPRETVEFDSRIDELTRLRVRKVGSDGKLVWDKTGRVLHVNLTEKLLIPLLAKLANFIPGAGIWLNTQRPEWNDANNALVGNGVSMVTLYQLRRHLEFCKGLFASIGSAQVNLSRETEIWLSATTGILNRRGPGQIDDAKRREALDGLGRAAEQFRWKIYSEGFSGNKVSISANQLLKFIGLAVAWTDRSIRANRRPDGLFHSYNLAEFGTPGKIALRRLPEMLEGQAAVLCAQFLSSTESLALLKTLRKSSLYRADQNSYLLYPDKELPRFVEKNNIPARVVQDSRLLKKLLADGNQLLIERDRAGNCHFNPSITNANGLRGKLAQLAADGYARLVKQESAAVLDLFEKMFNHREFTGRSGTFFGYEGLGCIYWHMLSKLRLAAQESFARAVVEDPASAPRLAGCYHDIRSGIGDFKTPENYGAFPMDPYSHTPGCGGARQPGLTGQVKEDILCRYGELGVIVRAAKIHFEPALLRREEFLQNADSFSYLDVSGIVKTIKLAPGSLAFTYCQVPVVYQLSRGPFLTVEFNNREKLCREVSVLDENNSRSIFERSGLIKSIVCGINPVTKSNNK
jgi:hypothetical protein